MNTLSTIIIDDNPTSMDILCHDLRKYADIEVVATTPSPMAALNLITTVQPDVCFLDVEMECMNGIELLQRLDEQHALPKRMKVVFYTAYKKYMIDAIRASAFDYLLKPYKADELEAIVNRLRITSQPTQNDAPTFSDSLRRMFMQEQRFTLQSITGLLILHHSQVVCFNYIDQLRCWQVMLTDRQKHRLRTTTRAQDITKINPNFKQVSNACIINMEYLASIENKTYRCCLYPPFNDIDVCVTRHYYTELRNSLERM